jgi:hypothetical protein
MLILPARQQPHKQGFNRALGSPIRTTFTQPRPIEVRTLVDNVARLLEGGSPVVARLLLEAMDDLLPSRTSRCRTGARSNPPTRSSGSTARSSADTGVVRIFPNRATLLRLLTCVLIEVQDEWQGGARHDLSEGSMALLNPQARTAIETKKPANARPPQRHVCPHSRSNTRRATPRRETRSA